MYKYNNIECVNYIPALHNNVEKYNINSDEDNIFKNSKKDKNSKKIEEVLINNITKQINKIESIAINRTNSNIKKGINTYKICNPQIGNMKANKKYVGLIFLNNESKR